MTDETKKSPSEVKFDAWWEANFGQDEREASTWSNIGKVKDAAKAAWDEAWDEGWSSGVDQGSYVSFAPR